VIVIESPTSRAWFTGHAKAQILFPLVWGIFPMIWCKFVLRLLFQFFFSAGNPRFLAQRAGTFLSMSIFFRVTEV